MTTYSSLISKGSDIIFCWLPSHVGIAGNERADSAAKAALSLPISHFNIPYTDFKPCINTFIFTNWQNTWNAALSNKLHGVKPTLGEWTPACRATRRDEVVLCRSRIGHSRLTNSYLLKREPQPQCVPCQSPLTVEHILIHCVDFADARRHFYNVATVGELFRDVRADKVLDFLKATNLYRQF